MIVKLYSIRNCRYCELIKNFFNNSGIVFEEIKVLRLGEEGTGMSFQEYAKIHRGIKTFPQVYIDNSCIGGITETIRYFNETK